MSKYQLDNSPIYIDGTDIPKNKLSITDSTLIHEIENQLLEQSYKHFISLLSENTLLDENYFINLHKKTFESLYDFAGVYRTVNMTKGDSQFCLAQYLCNESVRIFKELHINSYLANYHDVSTFAQKLAYFKGELIALHPFYELNGRTLRLYCDMLCIFNGYNPIDYSNTIENGLYIEASIECVQYANTEKLEAIILQGLSKR